MERSGKAHASAGGSPALPGGAARGNRVGFSHYAKRLITMTSPLKKAHPRVSEHRLGGVGTLCEASDLLARGVSPDRCNSSLGGRPSGCGRWSSALTEPFRLYVRSLTRAPLGRSVKRGGLLSKPKAPNVNGSKNPPAYCFGRAKQAPERSFLTGL